MTGDTTDTDDAIPWETGGDEPAGQALHLVIAWSLEEPERIGEAALLKNTSVLGRGTVGEGGKHSRVVFQKQRPGGVEFTPPLAGQRISREQLTFKVRGQSVHVENTGRCKLYVNGVQTNSAALGHGDVLRLHWAMVLLVVKRPTSFSPLNHYRAERSFSFGEPDADGMVGESPAAWQLRDTLAFAARSRQHVLLLGPTGAGKELAARAVHTLSSRAGRSFVTRNAATLPESLVDAELFGTAKDYPNVGSPLRPGIIAEADGGTLFLDEIGDLPTVLQPHLLRVLDRDGEYQRLGDSTARRSDLRLVAATNRQVGELKRDFAARLKMRVRVPGIAERVEDIPLLINHLLRGFAEADPELTKRFFEAREGRLVPRLSPELIEALLRHEYLEHTRELERALLVAFSTSSDEYVALSPGVSEALTQNVPDDTPELTREAIESALSRAGGSVTEAARQLRLRNRYALYRKMKQLGVPRPDHEAG
ncbi:MAG: sigma 54-interacting transcriptional regulator [Polyangiaceae bacterium]